MSASEALPPGIYEALLSEELRGLLDAHPELRPVFGKIDDESSAHTYSQFVWQVLRAALPALKPDQRLGLVNRLITLISATDGPD